MIIEIKGYGPKDITLDIKNNSQNIEIIEKLINCNRLAKLTHSDNRVEITRLTTEEQNELISNTELLDWEFLDDSAETIKVNTLTYEQQIGLLKNKCDIDFKDMSDIIGITDIIYNKLPEFSDEFWASGLTENMIETVSEEFNKIPKASPDYILTYDLIKDILKSLSVARTPESDWISRVTNASLAWISDRTKFRNFSEFIKFMYS